MFSLGAKPPHLMETAAEIGSLYVGDLHEEVTETLLFEIFSAVGPVISVRVCRDKVTKKSLGYGYVNFHTKRDAERALDTMNFTLIKGKACRLMWLQKDRNARENHKANIFISKLHPSIDNKTLFDTFSMFGNILSCKVASDRDGKSLGYGFVLYSNETEAQNAITRMNGMVIAEEKVEVQTYIPKAERQAGHTFTNIYIKNFPVDLPELEVRLNDLCIQYGDVTSIFIPKQADGTTPKGFLFCNYQTPEDAQNAIAKINGLEWNGVVLYASEHKSKASRKAELTLQQRENPGTNLYVKNLHPSIDDAELKEIFEPYGVIISAKVMTAKTGISREFGFIQFENPTAASKALAEMQDREIRGKKIYVGVFQPKDERVQVLKKQFEIKGSRVMNPNVGLGPNAFMDRPMPGHPMMGGMMMPPFGRAPMMPPQMGMRPPPPPFMGRMVPGMRGRQMPPQHMMPHRSTQKPNHAEDKQAIGEKLYPMVQRMEPKLAGKITGMLLEMDLNELVMLLDAPSDLLVPKINEAIEVLKAHNV